MYGYQQDLNRHEGVRTHVKMMVKQPNPGLVYRGCTRPLVVGGARGSNFVALSKMVHVLSCFV